MKDDLFSGDLAKNTWTGRPLFDASSPHALKVLRFTQQVDRRDSLANELDDSQSCGVSQRRRRRRGKGSSDGNKRQFAWM